MKKRISGRAFVILLEREEIRIAQMNLGASAPQIQETIVLPTPEGAVEDGFILQAEPLRDCLRSALTAPELKRTRKVVFSLCSTQVLSVVTTIPAVADRQVEKLVNANMDIYFPVDVKDYHLVWTPIGVETDENGTEVRSVQLWAVPNALLVRYYHLANELGFSVEAIDYCGNSFVSMVGASFADAASARQPVMKRLALPKLSTGKKKAGRRLQSRNRRGNEAERVEIAAATAVLEPPEPDGGDTMLYLLAEPDFLLMTFVRDGQVKLQRMIQQGGAFSEELSEIQMAMEFYDSMADNRYRSVQAFLYGSLANNPEYVQQMEFAVGTSIQIWDGQPGPEWCLCLGASKAKLDFGVPAMNQPRSSIIASQALQYGLVLGGGLLLAGSLVLTFGSRAVWDSTISGLEANRDSLQLQAAQGAGNAQRYYDYETAYNNYSSDWDTLFNSLRTYNDNLVLILDELETLLPSTTSVTEIGIAEEGLALQLACQSKEEAAYVILTLRYNLQYGSLNSVSDLTVGPGVSALSVLPSLAAQTGAGTADGQDQANADSNSEAGTTEETTEAPPTEGSQYDLASLLEIMQQAMQGSGSTDYMTILAYALENGLITEGDLRSAIENLTPEQLAALESVYGVNTDTTYTLDELLETATLAQREAALRTMLTEDPMAVYLFAEVFQEDMQRPAGTEILFAIIYDDLWSNSDTFMNLMNGDLEAVQEAVPTMLDILTKNEETVSATEELIQTNQSLSEKLAYYLALEMGLDPNPSTSPGTGEETGNTGTGGNTGSGNAGNIDVGQIIDDIINGTVPTDDEALNDALSSLAPDLEDSGLTMEDILQMIQDSQGNGGSSIGDIIGNIGGNGDIFSPDTGDPGAGTEPADTRTYVTVTIGYNEELRLAELDRRGLTYEGKIGRLEVEE
ncbi:type IV pilus biogenesis protein PilM [Intestinimonas massiliensis (ex Afouda et al. 2020)]|uniref:type IV pilus biogenesis protein PilM n=1 Tax=Intestinimonas massiliensis (ex Afouda et al. 2020) TaxID=1673721 RepID=UPI001030EF10|nr:hypothetical protein [Intestinimonas massiliensis (ex Afouda et al. 2020)]